MEARMSKLLTATLVAFFISSAHAEEKWLQYDFSDQVWIRIANVPCPIKQIKGYPYGAVAYHKQRKEYLFGCFNKKNEDEIVIQWAGGDKTILPANAFLIADDKN